jgi:hypothetical protein
LDCGTIPTSIRGNRMSIEKKPFVNYTLDENKKYTDVEVISLKLNIDERAQINRLKKITNYGQDAKVIKLSLIIAEKVILGLFGDDLFMKLTLLVRKGIVI